MTKDQELVITIVEMLRSEIGIKRSEIIGYVCQVYSPLFGVTYDITITSVPKNLNANEIKEYISKVVVQNWKETYENKILVNDSWKVKVT